MLSNISLFGHLSLSAPSHAVFRHEEHHRRIRVHGHGMDPGRIPGLTAVVKRLPCLSSGAPVAAKTVVFTHKKTCFFRSRLVFRAGVGYIREYGRSFSSSAGIPSLFSK